MHSYKTVHASMNSFSNYRNQLERVVAKILLRLAAYLFFVLLPKVKYTRTTNNKGKRGRRRERETYRWSRGLDSVRGGTTLKFTTKRSWNPFLEFDLADIQINRDWMQKKDVRKMEWGRARLIFDLRSSYLICWSSERASEGTGEDSEI